MSATGGAADTSPPHRLSRIEFVALAAMLVSTVAFSVDAMLPAMSEIAGELTPDAPNRAALIITIFVLGMGIGTLFVGSLSDAYGRRPVLIAGSALFIAAAFWGWVAGDIETVLAARFVQGLAAAVPRITTQAIVRDQYSGRQMARVLSLVFMVFTLVPVLAPALGAVLIWSFGWRSIFLAFVVFALVSTTWFALRQPETLAPEHRRPLAWGAIRSGVGDVIAAPVTSRSILAQCFVFGILFTMLSTTQPVFATAFDAEESFPFWFGFVALMSAGGSYLNSRIVERLGMHLVVSRTASLLLLACVLFILAGLAGLDAGPAHFGGYIAFMVAVFLSISLTIGNLNALAMEPLGHIAGLASSVIGAVSTVGGALLGMLAGLMFDGSALSPALFIAGYCVAIILVVRTIPTEE